MKPDWKNFNHTYGGTLKDIPLPHIRKFPHYPYKRRVTASITSWVGIGIGAKHTYATLEEEDNPIWNSTRERWQDCWVGEDPEGRGKRIEAEFIDKRGRSAEDQAKDWIRKTFAKEFSSKTHRLHYRNCIREPKWLYRDGD